MLSPTRPATSKPMQGLETCHLLQVLLAPNNTIKELPRTSLQHCPLLRRLDLSGNHLSALPSLPPLPHLAALLLSDNGISTLAPLKGAALPQLQHLDLSFNALSGVGCVGCLSGLASLVCLQLHDNPVARVGGYAAAVVQQLPWLQELDRQQVGSLPGQQQGQRQRQVWGHQHEQQQQQQPAQHAEQAGHAPQGRLQRRQLHGGEDAAGAGDLADVQPILLQGAAMQQAAYNAAARSPMVALALVWHLETMPGASLGASIAQQQASVQHWLPALHASALNSSSTTTSSAITTTSSSSDGPGSRVVSRSPAAPSPMHRSPGAQPSIDPWQPDWDHSTAMSLAHQQSLQWAALATLKPRPARHSRGSTCPNSRITNGLPQQEGGPGNAEVMATAAALGAAAVAAQVPAWLSVWSSETGCSASDAGCEELLTAAEGLGYALGAAHALEEVRAACGCSSRRVAADCAGTSCGDGGSGGGGCSSCGGGDSSSDRSRTNSGGSSSSNSRGGASSNSSGSGSGGPCSWLEAQELHEQRQLTMTTRHLAELLQPPEAHQEVLQHHAAFARRLSGLRAAAEAASAAAATALQAAWRGKMERGWFANCLAVETATALERAAVFLQAAWRGRVMRCREMQQRLEQFVSAEAAAAALAGRPAGGMVSRWLAAVVIQSALRGCLVRRRMRAALAVARGSRAAGSIGVRGCSDIERLDSLGSFDSIGDDFLQLSPDLEAELMGLGLGNMQVRGSAGVAANTATGQQDTSPIPAAATKAVRSGKGTASAAVGGAGGAYVGHLLVTPQPSTVVHPRDLPHRAEAAPCGVPRMPDAAAGDSEDCRSSCPEGGADSSSGSGGGGGDDQGGDCDGSPGARAAARATRLEAKLRGLMAEWGFHDMATAKAYYK